MSLTATSLASGSSGNALLVRHGDAALLVDCGLSQRAIERALARAGLRPGDLHAILLTHEHGDHTLSAPSLARRHGVPLVASGPTLAALSADLAGVAVRELPVGTCAGVGAFSVRSFPVPHDAAAPVGYAIAAGNWQVGVAIDLGSWTEDVVEGLADADLVVIEANHDQTYLWSAPYSKPLKQRIHGPSGHLDNIAAGRLLARLGADGRRRSAWLAHLSQEANSPHIAEKVVRGVLALAGVTWINVTALPRRAPLSWSSDRHMEQMTLFES
ncbi:MAG: MBL fold metallo-hydrolase [Chloroflexi bacterium]|nr:MBL fold metallo-hydrolase [Chloroflexota bacterium]